MYTVLACRMWTVRIVVVMGVFTLAQAGTPCRAAAEEPPPAETGALHMTQTLPAAAQLDWDRAIRVAAADTDSTTAPSEPSEMGSRERTAKQIVKEAARDTLRVVAITSIVVGVVGIGYVVVVSDMYSDARDRENQLANDPFATKQEKRSARDDSKRTGDNLVTGLVVTVAAFGVGVATALMAKALDDEPSGGEKKNSAGGTKRSFSLAFLPSFSASSPNTVLATYRW